MDSTTQIGQRPLVDISAPLDTVAPAALGREPPPGVHPAVIPAGRALDSLLEVVPDGVIVATEEGTIVAANRRAARMFGWPQAELVGRSVDHLLPEELRRTHARHRARYSRDPVARPMGQALDLRARRRDGTDFAVDVSLAPVSDEAGRHLVVAAVRDVTERQEAARALAESELRLREAQAAGHMGHWRRDLATGTLSWSDELFRIFGVDPTDFSLEFDSLLALVHPADRDHLLSSVDAALEREEAASYEYRIVRPDGGVRWISTRAQRVLGPDATPVALTGVSQDVTERREAEERYRLVSETVTDVAVAFVVGEDGFPTVEWVTDGHERLSGYTIAETHEYGFGELVHPDDRDWYGERLAGLAPGERDESEVRIVRKDGEVLWTRITFQRADSADGRLRFVGAVRDITEQRAAAEAQREAYRQQQESLSRLREADRLKDEFISTASHELRTPAAAIAGLAAALSRHSNRLAPEIRGEIAEKLERNAVELGAMVERLLDFSRLQSGTATIEPRAVRLGDVLRHCLEIHARELTDHPLRIDVDAGLHVWVDPHGITHVLSNLVTNAAKYSPSGAGVTITARRSAGEVVVGVEDEGAGIPDADQDRIFERFVRGSAQGPGQRGTGIGLAIARSYVELMGGRLWLESVPGRGSKFWFSVPPADEPDAHEPDADEPDADVGEPSGAGHGERR